MSVQTGSGGDYLVLGTGDGASAAQVQEEAEAPGTDVKKIMVLCATDRMGVGDDVLGLKLMASFLRTLKEMGGELWRPWFTMHWVKFLPRTLNPSVV